jgi:hypothetical protein
MRVEEKKGFEVESSGFGVRGQVDLLNLNPKTSEGQRKSCSNEQAICSGVSEWDSSWYGRVEDA